MSSMRTCIGLAAGIGHWLREVPEHTVHRRDARPFLQVAGDDPMKQVLVKSS
jgi:hypothetical protein